MKNKNKCLAYFRGFNDDSIMEGIKTMLSSHPEENEYTIDSELPYVLNKGFEFPYGVIETSEGEIQYYYFDGYTNEKGDLLEVHYKRAIVFNEYDSAIEDVMLGDGNIMWRPK